MILPALMFLTISHVKLSRRVVEMINDRNQLFADRTDSVDTSFPIEQANDTRPAWNR